MTNREHAPDKRLTLALPHLADRALRGIVEAERFVSPSTHRLLDGAALVHKSPQGEVVTELLYGEDFRILETGRDGWAFGQCVHDGYVGYVQARFGAALASPTHRVITAGTHLYERPSVRSEIHLALAPGARLTLAAKPAQQGWAETDDGRFVPARHLGAIATPQPDPVSVARLLLHAPYRWGGRSRNGYDCSGLVQIALQLSGHDCPRDTDMQEAALGAPLTMSAPLRRGDLVFWKGHVGLMTDHETLLHANGHHMAVAAEPLSAAMSRIASVYGEVTSIRRGPWVSP